MKKITALIFVATLLAGCEVAPTVPEKTSLEIQAFQSKMFDVDKSTGFRSVLSVLQDLGYTVLSASLDTGVITAQSPVKQDESGGAAFAQIFGGVRTEGRTYVTATIEGFSEKKTQIRLNLIDRRFRSSAYGQQATDEKVIEDPKIYQNAFAKIGDAIFIRQSQK